jgi:hypothetical protein
VNRAPGTVFVGVCACVCMRASERPRRRNCSSTSTVGKIPRLRSRRPGVLRAWASLNLKR